jgi:hypothetical protein
MRHRQPQIFNNGASLFEIKLFLGTAAAEARSALGYPAGERHALLIFCRQLRGTEPDWALARLAAREAGWREIEFLNASTADVCSADLDETARVSCKDAMAEGSAIIVYSEPV